jgi:hypothetical protein
VKTNEFYGRISVHYGNNCMKQRDVYRLVERFEEECSRFPSNVTWVEVKGRSVSISRTTEESALMKLHLKSASFMEEALQEGLKSN